jgi:hypothetical protein
MNKRAILTTLAITMLPLTAWGWDNRYNNDRNYYDQERNSQLQRIADEMEYRNEMEQYQDQVREYEKANPEPIQQIMLKHYYKWPQKPKRK